MNALSSRISYRATMLTEPLTGYPMDQRSRAAFERNFTSCADDATDIMFNASAKLQRSIISLDEIDLNPTPAAHIQNAVTRLLELLPVGVAIDFETKAYFELVAQIREELAYIWRRRLEGVEMAAARMLQPA